MAKGYRFTDSESEQMLSQGYSKVYVDSEEEMVEKQSEYKSKGYKSRMSHEYNRITKEYTFLLYVKAGETTIDSHEALFDELLKERVAIIKPRVWDVVHDYGYTHFEPRLMVKPLKKGNLGYVNSTFEHMVISTELLGLDDMPIIDTVIAHELFHCVKESHGHDKVWKKLTRVYNELYNDRITTYSNELIKTSPMLHSWKYRSICNKCGTLNVWRKDCNSYQNHRLGLVTCKCGGTFETF